MNYTLEQRAKMREEIEASLVRLDPQARYDVELLFREMLGLLNDLDEAEKRVKALEAEQKEREAPTAFPPPKVCLTGRIAPDEKKPNDQ